VEVAQVLEQGRDLLDTLLTGGLHAEHMPPQVTPRAGWGAGVVEAPRGLLFHSYAFNEHGICTDANMIIPTNQNHANLQRDLEVFLPQIIEREPEEIRLLLEMLIRAYDPCISCSTHYLEVIFV
jgi:coenzyme F420-reducing hydrogenase alpha subunit